MSSARTRYLLPALIGAFFCAQVMAPVSLADNGGLQQASAGAGVQLGEDATREIVKIIEQKHKDCLLYTSPSPRD